MREGKSLKKDKTLKKLIYRDCIKAMSPATFFYSIDNIATEILMVYTAGVLGLFADAVFNLDMSYGIENLWILLLSIGITVFIIPFFGLLGELLMHANALKHDRIVLSRYLDKNYSEVINIDLGEAQSRLEQDPIDFRCEWVDIIVKFGAIPLTLAYLLYQTLQISLLVTVIIFAVSAIKFTVPLLTKKLQAKYDKETREYNTQVRKYETDIIARPHIVKLYGLSASLTEKLDCTYRIYFEKVFKKNIKHTTVAKNISSFLDTFCTLVILLVGAVMIANGRISVGALVAMIGYFSVFNKIIANASDIIVKIPILKNLVERMEVLYVGIEDLSGEKAENTTEISANNLSFYYDNENVIFENINFTVKLGEKVAIVGANGSGKSTFVKLLCGLVKDYTGSLQINGLELNSISIESWRKQIAYAAQNPFLFEGTVKNNVHFGNLHATEQEVELVMKKIGIEYLSERTASMNQNDLSGGEKQKISIARALMKDTPFLILDEPSNNLDKQTINWLSVFIAEFPKSILFISHNKQLINLADKQIYF